MHFQRGLWTISFIGILYRIGTHVFTVIWPVLVQSPSLTCLRHEHMEFEAKKTTTPKCLFSINIDRTNKQTKPADPFGFPLTDNSTHIGRKNTNRRGDNRLLQCIEMNTDNLFPCSNNASASTTSLPTAVVDAVGQRTILEAIPFVRDGMDGGWFARIGTSLILVLGTFGNVMTIVILQRLRSSRLDSQFVGALSPVSHKILYNNNSVLFSVPFLLRSTRPVT